LRTCEPKRGQLLVAGFLLGCIGLANAQVAPAQQGQLSVSESGALVYALPIAVSPGVAGMEPKLSLTYSSQGGGSHAGMGWSLGGLSAISRCPKTPAQDGVRRAVRYDSGDSYCLDGRRLMATGGGTEGADGTVYRAEIDDASHIQSHFNGNPAPWSGPTYWTVKTKSGLTLQFGEPAATSDARWLMQGKNVARTWALKTITDIKGNYLTVTYGGDAANGEFYPTRIDYAGNTAAGTLPANSVRFNYQALSDAIPGYVAVPAYSAGSVFRTTVRLASIQSYAGTTLVSTTTLTYGAPVGPTRASRVASIQVCDGGGNCRVPLSFGYGTDSTSFAPTAGAVSLPPAAGATGYFRKNDGTGTYMDLVDLNGDGLLDFYSSGGSAAWLGIGGGAFSGTSVAWPAPAGSSGYLRRSDGNGTYIDLVDLNGDGLPDFYNSGNGAAWLNTGSGFAASASAWPLPVAASTSGYFRRADSNGTYIDLADMNGDGLPDLYVSASSAVWLNTGSGFAASPISWPAPAGSNTGGYLRRSDTVGTWAELIDMNGDGLPDLYNSGSSAVWLNTGTGFASTPISWPLPSGANANGYLRKADGTGTYLDLADVNGDGLPDVYLSGGSAAWLNTGNGFASTPVAWVAPAGSNTSGYLSRSDAVGTYIGLFDMNGDGMPDLLNTGASAAGMSQGKGDSFLISVAAGSTVLAQIDYKKLSDGPVYTRDSGASAAVLPKVDLQPAMYVVSEVRSNNGIGGQSAVQYTYGGLKAEQGTGRGMLGFRWTKAKNVDTGVENYTEFRQDWPFIGMASKSETRLAGSGNGGLLKRATTTYAQGPGSASPSIFVYASQSMEESWDLNGAQLPTITTVNQYSQSPQYGDPTQIQVTLSDGSSKTTVNEYWPVNTTGGNWILGRLKKATVTSNKP
jgi:hypothetical protein